MALMYLGHVRSQKKNPILQGRIKPPPKYQRSDLTVKLDRKNRANQGRLWHEANQRTP